MDLDCRHRMKVQGVTAVAAPCGVAHEDPVLVVRCLIG